MLTYDLDDYNTDFTNDTIDSTERLIVSASGIDSAKHTLITNSKWTEDNGIEWKDENGVSWRFEEITNDSKTLYFTRGSNNLGSYTLVKLPTELTYDKELKLTCTSEW
jgi:hypothetical protein